MLTSSQSCMARGVKTVNLIDCQGVLDSSCSKRGTKKRAKWEKNACHGLVFICRHKQQGERQIMSGRHLMGTKALLRCWVLFTDTLQTDTLDSTILNNNKKNRKQKWRSVSVFNFQIRTHVGGRLFTYARRITWCIRSEPSVMGNILLELLGGGGKVSIIRQGTHQCLAKKWGLMSVQQGEGERLTLSQSMSTNIMVTVQLSPASIGGGLTVFVKVATSVN